MKLILILFIASLSGMAQAHMLDIKVWTGEYNRFFMPMSKDSIVSMDTKDKVHCMAQFEVKKLFKIKCERDNKLILFYQDTTPEINAKLMGDDIFIEVIGK